MHGSHAVDGVLYFVHVEDVFQQFCCFGDGQVLDLWCDAFQGSCQSAEVVSSLFAISVLVILLAIGQSLDFMFQLFDLLFVFLFFGFQIFELGLGVYSIVTSFVWGQKNRLFYNRRFWVDVVVQTCGMGMI